MEIVIIAAVARNLCIGVDGHLPWNLPREYAYYQNCVRGHTTIIGRVNYQANSGDIEQTKPLIITRNPQRKFPHPSFSSLEQAFQFARSERGDQRVYVVGGAEIYHLALPHATEMIISRVETSPEGDAYFPQVNWSQWAMEDSTHFSPDQKNPLAYQTQIWMRRDH